MEKSYSSPPPENPELDDLKLKEEATLARDVGIGQVLEVEATPEQERKVLRKLDMMYVHAIGR